MSIPCHNLSAMLTTDHNNNISNSSISKVALESIQTYYAPILVAFGSIGNWLSVLVFFRTKLSKLSSSIYLAALAISDTVFLLTLFVVWLNLIDVEIFNQTIGCPLTVYLSNVSCFMSVWFVVAFTVERFIAVSYPLKRPSMCTVTRAKLVLAGLTVLSLLLNAPYLVISGPQLVVQHDRNCTVVTCSLNSDYLNLAKILNNFDTVVTFVLPFVIISVLNASVCLIVWKLARVRQTMTNRDTTSLARTARNCTSSQTKVTKMLLFVSTVFLCLNLPSYVIRIWVYFSDAEDGEKPNDSFVILQHASLLLFNTNFGINFVLYCVSGENFRKSLVSLFCPRRLARSDTTKVTVVSEFGRSYTGRRRTMTLNGSWREAHEMIPLSRQH